MATLTTTTAKQMYGFIEDANGSVLTPANPKYAKALQGVFDKFAGEVYHTVEDHPAGTDNLKLEIEGQQFILSHECSRSHRWYLVKVQSAMTETKANEQQARLGRMFGK